MDVVAVNTPERLFSLFATLSGLIVSLVGNVGTFSLRVLYMLRVQSFRFRVYSLASAEPFSSPKGPKEVAIHKDCLGAATVLPRFSFFIGSINQILGFSCNIPK